MSRATFHRRSLRTTLGGALVTLAMGESAARAQLGAPDAEARAKAVVLWQEGSALREQQRHPEACVKFRESLAVLRAPGTLLHVAACFVLENDPDRAYSTFEEVIEMAAAEESARRTAFIEAARREIESLERQFAKVAIHVSQSEGVEIYVTDPTRSNERRVPAEQMGRLLLKPGPYQLRVTAPGHIPFSRAFYAVAGVPSSFRPQLEPVAATPPPPPARPVVGQTESARVLPWVLTGAGTAVLAAGVVTGVLYSDKARQLEKSCRAPDFQCPAESEEPGWQDKIDEAKRLALVTHVLGATGLVTIGVGVALLVFGGESETDVEATRVDAGCVGASCGLTLQGRF